MAAFFGRLSQSMLQDRGRVHIYLDDPLFTLRGPEDKQRALLGHILLVWRALGFNLSWKKCSFGTVARPGGPLWMFRKRLPITRA